MRIRACRDTIRKARSQTDMELVRDIRDGNKVFYKYIKIEKKKKEREGLLLKGT